MNGELGSMNSKWGSPYRTVSWRKSRPSVGMKKSPDQINITTAFM